jgi:hypothetical protein
MRGFPDDSLCQASPTNLIKRQVPFLKESDNIINVAISLEDTPDTKRSLVVGSSLTRDEYSVLEIQPGNACARRFYPVGFLIHKHEKVVAKAIYLLVGGAERARRLGLLDGRHFQVYLKLREIDPTRRISGDIGKLGLQIFVEL